MMVFKPGDKVEIIDNTDLPKLILGRIYTIKRKGSIVSRVQQYILEEYTGYTPFEWRLRLAGECYKCIYTCKSEKKCSLFMESEK